MKTIIQFELVDNAKFTDQKTARAHDVPTTFSTALMVNDLVCTMKAAPKLINLLAIDAFCSRAKAYIVIYSKTQLCIWSCL